MAQVNTIEITNSQHAPITGRFGNRDGSCRGHGRAEKHSNTKLNLRDFGSLVQICSICGVLTAVMEIAAILIRECASGPLNRL